MTHAPSAHTCGKGLPKEGPVHLVICVSTHASCISRDKGKLLMQMQNNKTIKDPSMYFNSDRKRLLQKYLERNNTLKPLCFITWDRFLKITNHKCMYIKRENNDNNAFWYCHVKFITYKNITVFYNFKHLITQTSKHHWRVILPHFITF